MFTILLFIFWMIISIIYTHLTYVYIYFVNHCNYWLLKVVLFYLFQFRNLNRHLESYKMAWGFLFATLLQFTLKREKEKVLRKSSSTRTTSICYLLQTISTGSITFFFSSLFLRKRSTPSPPPPLLPPPLFFLWTFLFLLLSFFCWLLPPPSFLFSLSCFTGFGDFLSFLTFDFSLFYPFFFSFFFLLFWG